MGIITAIIALAAVLVFVPEHLPGTEMVGWDTEDVQTYCQENGLEFKVREGAFGRKFDAHCVSSDGVQYMVKVKPEKKRKTWP